MVPVPFNQQKSPKEIELKKLEDEEEDDQLWDDTSLVEKRSGEVDTFDNFDKVMEKEIQEDALKEKASKYLKKNQDKLQELI